MYEALLPAAAAAAEEAAPKIQLQAEQQALVWIQYMRFVRRTEGRDKSRKVCVGDCCVHTHEIIVGSHGACMYESPTVYHPQITSNI